MPRTELHVCARQALAIISMGTTFQWSTKTTRRCDEAGITSSAISRMPYLSHSAVNPACTIGGIRIPLVQQRARRLLQRRLGPSSSRSPRSAVARLIVSELVESHGRNQDAEDAGMPGSAAQRRGSQSVLERPRATWYERYRAAILTTCEHTTMRMHSRLLGHVCKEEASMSPGVSSASFTLRRAPLLCMNDCIGSVAACSWIARTTRSSRVRCDAHQLAVEVDERFPPASKSRFLSHARQNGSTRTVDTRIVCAAQSSDICCPHSFS